MKKEKIKYRRGSLNDFELTFEIKKKSLKPFIKQIWGWDEKTQLKYHKEKFDPTKIEIIKYDKIEIGFYELIELKEKSILKNILIIKDYQSKGIGRMVMMKIINDCFGKSPKLRLQVFKINKKARLFYEKLGFELIGTQENHLELELNLKKRLFK